MGAMSLYTVLLFAVLSAAAASSLNKSELKERIIGGGSALTAPCVASLRSLTHVHFCGATIVNNRYVVTSAQCTARRVPSSILVVVGTISTSVSGVSHVGFTIIQHNGFNHITMENDIALIQTATTIQFNINVQAAQFPARLVGINLQTQVFGWGIISRNGQDSTTLQRLTVRIISNDNCRSLHGSQGWRINENKMCTEASTTGTICYGDEGGPILSSNGEEILGIISWHSNCLLGLPSVYERFLPHRLWVMSFIQ